MIYISLILEFFKIGLFSIGGGLATIPFLSELGDKYGWFTHKELIDMIAISESTPGPIGINMATYAGYKVAGVFGAVIATLSEVLPAIIIITIIAKALFKYKNNSFFNKLMIYIRPCTFALILIAFISVFTDAVLPIDKINNIDYKLPLLFIAMYIFKYKTNYHPLVYIILSALFGIILF